MIAQGLYVGQVMHRRFRPKPHRFAYSCFWLALDLDQLERTARRLRLFSLERFNLFSFYASDHADGAPGDLKGKIASQARDAGFDASGRMVLLTMPRVLGYVFNPLSVYFCHDPSGLLTAIAWEVSNTFGARHTYIIAVELSADGAVRQSCPKLLHVSPFLDMDIAYQFRVEAIGEALRIGILDRAGDGVVFAAALSAQWRNLDDPALLAISARIPLATLKVTFAIHWEALRLWLKGARFRAAPAGSTQPIAAHAVSAHGEPAPALPPLS